MSNLSKAFDKAFLWRNRNGVSVGLLREVAKDIEPLVEFVERAYARTPDGKRAALPWRTRLCVLFLGRFPYK